MGVATGVGHLIISTGILASASCVPVGVGVGVGVDVGVGVSVGVSGGENAVAVLVTVGVESAVGVRVAVFVPVRVWVTVGVRVIVAVTVLVFVGTRVGVAAVVISGKSKSAAKQSFDIEDVAARRIVFDSLPSPGVVTSMRSIGLTLALAFVLSGCALAVKGSTQLVMVDSVPPNREVLVDGKPYVTPAQISLARYYDHQIIARNENGARVERMIHSHPDYLPWSWVSFAVVPFLGPAVDAYFGGDRELKPPQVLIPMPPDDAAPDFLSLAPPSPVRMSREHRGLAPEE